MKPLLVISIALLLTSPVYADDTIAEAKELYFSANYEDALSVLSRLESPTGAPSDRLAINQYRAFCLLALGRTTEAERAIEAVVSADPFFHPADTDASPRLRTAFAAVRARILPLIVQQEYAIAKAAFDRQEYAVAGASFERVIRALSDPDLGAAAGRPPLSDLRVLAGGFYELSLRAAAPPPAPEPAPVPVVAPPAPKPNAIYTGTEAGLTLPVTLRQQLPNFPRDLVQLGNGVLEVVINELGNVDRAVMRTSINPRFDALVIGYAKTWKYEPARVSGTPVKFRKTINITLKTNSGPGDGQ